MKKVSTNLAGVISLDLNNIIENFRISLSRPTILKSQGFKRTLIIGALFFAGYFILHKIYFHLGIFLSIYYAFAKTVAIIISYLLFKEMEPDYMYSARVAIIITGIVLIFFKEASALALIFFLIATRFLTRSSGESNGILDYAILSFFGMLLFLINNYIFLLYLGMVFMFDFRLKGKNLLSPVLGAGFTIIAIMNFFKIYNTIKTQLKIWEIVVIITISILYALRLSFLKRVLSTDDKKNAFISPNRLRIANVLVMVFTLLYYVNFGRFQNVLPVLVVMTCSAFPFLGDILKEQNRD